MAKYPWEIEAMLATQIQAGDMEVPENNIALLLEHIFLVVLFPPLYF